MYTHSNNKYSLFTRQCLLLLSVIVFTTNLWAQAGTSIFTFGKASLRSADGSLTQLSKGMPFNTGDTILTGVNGRVQLRMADGAIFDIKPNTEFIIEEYHYSTAATDTSVAKKPENKSFYRLMRGGFRTISGLIGKRNKKNYRITTPVATIGIRGTDFSVDLCEVNCSPVHGKGLYLSVGSGGVIMVNDGGSLEVDAGFGGFAADQSTAPVPSGAEIADYSGRQSIGSDSSTGSGYKIETDNNISSDNRVLSGGEAPVMRYERAAISINGGLDQSMSSDANLGLAANDALTGFTTPAAVYDIGTALTDDQGFDATTGLTWGRWSGGTATITIATASRDVNLESRSAHWIYNRSQVTPVLPLTGKASFSLLGNTNPSDNKGNMGTLGLASLSADFTNQTVNTAVNLTINQLIWDAIATNVPLDSDAASFGGNFDQVVISDSTGALIKGLGSLEGFFTGDANGAVAGAGMAYHLSDNVGTDVEGSVAFILEQSPVQ